MKPISLLTTLLLTVTTAPAAWLTPTNPPAWVQLGWDTSPSPSVTNYWIYYGVGSNQYTNKVSVGNVTQAALTNFVRGTTYYFACTCGANGLESLFSNEISWTPTLPPSPPTGLKTTNTVVAMKIESAPTPTGPWTLYATLSTSVEAPAFFRSVVSITPPSEPVPLKPMFLSPKKKSA